MAYRFQRRADSRRWAGLCVAGLLAWGACLGAAGEGSGGPPPGRGGGLTPPRTMGPVKSPSATPSPGASVPGHPARGKAEGDATDPGECCLLRRALTLAIGSYRLDLDIGGPVRFDQNAIDALVQAGYLAHRPVHPGMAPGSERNFHWLAGHWVDCRLHPDRECQSCSWALGIQGEHPILDRTTPPAPAPAVEARIDTIMVALIANAADAGRLRSPFTLHSWQTFPGEKRTACRLIDLEPDGAGLPAGKGKAVVRMSAKWVEPDETIPVPGLALLCLEPRQPGTGFLWPRCRLVVQARDRAGGMWHVGDATVEPQNWAMTTANVSIAIPVRTRRLAARVGPR